MPATPRLGALLPRIVTPPPGPQSRRLARALARYESPGVSTLSSGDAPIAWDAARGANVRDADGNVYVDCTAGFGVAGAGHANPRIVAAVRRQAGVLLHGLGDVHPNAPRLALAERLSRLLPGKENQAMFATSGSEAVELALKTAAKFTGKHGVVAFDNAYHGETYGTMAVTAREHFSAPFAPQINARVARVPYPYCYRCPLGKTYPSCDVACLAPVEKTIRRPPRGVGAIGAVLIEPVQGRGGVIVPPPEYMPRLRDMCDRNGVLLIADEIMTGLGRTGRWLAMQHWGVAADITAVGKALSGGMPISACAAPARVMSAWAHEESEAPHASTYMGHPVASAAALASLDEIELRRLPQRAARLGDYAMRRLREMQQRYAIMGDVRGLGLLLGVELVRDGPGKKPAPEAASAIVRHALAHGVIILAGGAAGNVLTLTPPLTITRRQLDCALDVIEEGIAKVN